VGAPRFLFSLSKDSEFDPEFEVLAEGKFLVNRRSIARSSSDRSKRHSQHIPPLRAWHTALRQCHCLNGIRSGS
jgi:hypothetical protein